MGASLLANALYQPTMILNVMAPSRAGSLPQWFCVGYNIVNNTHQAARDYKDVRGPNKNTARRRCLWQRPVTTQSTVATRNAKSPPI
ncbi:hypothetical protein EAH72_12170 [Pseudomonas caspiana]|uniref:Uncharacterized protein n=1 Tax=Pseudomonas mandelii TaxID=75612 RepID=A0A502I8W7_9PSED|nr:hypothetical protein EAH74_16065 [Pseudomonas mandelii]TPG96236.1 hypothetical protein EAH72_12170 [Pseudomonas caspiana]